MKGIASWESYVFAAAGFVRHSLGTLTVAAEATESEQVESWGLADEALVFKG